MTCNSCLRGGEKLYIHNICGLELCGDCLNEHLFDVGIRELVCNPEREEG